MEHVPPQEEVRRFLPLPCLLFLYVRTSCRVLLLILSVEVGYMSCYHKNCPWNIILDKRITAQQFSTSIECFYNTENNEW